MAQTRTLRDPEATRRLIRESGIRLAVEAWPERGPAAWHRRGLLDILEMIERDFIADSAITRQLTALRRAAGPRRAADRPEPLPPYVAPMVGMLFTLWKSGLR